MRPEKKSLQLLQTPDDKASQDEQVNTTKRCLLKIGDHIEKCLEEIYQQQGEVDFWRRYCSNIIYTSFDAVFSK